MTSLQRHVTANAARCRCLQSPGEQIVRAPIFEFGMSVMPQGRDEARPSPTWLAPSGARREALVTGEDTSLALLVLLFTDHTQFPQPVMLAHLISQELRP